MAAIGGDDGGVLEEETEDVARRHVLNSLRVTVIGQEADIAVVHEAHVVLAQIVQELARLQAATSLVKRAFHDRLRRLVDVSTSFETVLDFFQLARRQMEVDVAFCATSFGLFTLMLSSVISPQILYFLNDH